MCHFISIHSLNFIRKWSKKIFFAHMNIPHGNSSLFSIFSYFLFFIFFFLMLDSLFFLHTDKRARYLSKYYFNTWLQLNMIMQAPSQLKWLIWMNHRHHYTLTCSLAFAIILRWIALIHSIHSIHSLPWIFYFLSLKFFIFSYLIILFIKTNVLLFFIAGMLNVFVIFIYHIIFGYQIT